MTAVVETHPLQFPWTFTFFKKAANKGYEENTSVLGTTESVRSARPLVSLGPRLTSFDRANPIRGVCHRSSPPPPPPLQVEDFWRLYVHLRRPVDDRPTVCDYHVFREGIKPMWEDETNVNGGKWIVRLKKGVAARYWEDLVRSHPPLLRRPSPHAREIWQLTQRLLGRSSSRCWGGSSRWETRSAGPCSPCATRRTSCPSGPLQPRPGPHPEHTPHSGPQALGPSAPRAQALRPSGSLHPEHRPSARGPAPVPAPTPAPRTGRNKSADSRRVCMQIRTTLCSVLQLPMDASLEYKKHTDSMRDNSSYRNANSNFG